MVAVRLVCSDLPRLDGVLLGVQVGRQVEQVEQVVASTVGACVLEVEVTALADDVRGPAVHGPRGSRFLYLSWGTAPGFTMYRRAKLPLLPHLPLLHLADASGGVLELVHALTGPDGTPRCATLSPESVRVVLA